MKYKIEKVITDVSYTLAIGEIGYGVSINIGDEVSIQELTKGLKVKYVVKRITREYRTISDNKYGISYPEEFFVFQGGVLLTTLRAEEVNRAMNILSGLCKRKVSLKDVEIYLFEGDYSNYPIICYDKYIVLITPFTVEVSKK